jgi:cob(I)alamin adenosyltransferase
MKKEGLLLVNTGNGKGKTTAALGTLVRALGHGQKAAFIQFLKSAPTGESRFLEELSAARPESLRYAKIGLGFVGDSPSQGDRDKAREAMDLAAALSPDLDLLVLDEVCVALDKGLIPLSGMLGFIAGRPAGLNLVLTGRGCPEEIIELADTVTEMREIKHAYRSGIPARKGLDF